ncbi:MAG TPA: hypothetical protein VF940_20385 [Streptosporangiaceae bacterium]
MNRLEERLRDACQAAADTVTREMDAPEVTVVQAAASLGNGAEVVAATKDWPHFGCRSWLYQFRLTAAGQPTRLKPFVVPQVHGWARQLGGSGDGRMAVS